MSRLLDSLSQRRHINDMFDEAPKGKVLTIFGHRQAILADSEAMVVRHVLYVLNIASIGIGAVLFFLVWLVQEPVVATGAIRDWEAWLAGLAYPLLALVLPATVGLVFVRWMYLDAIVRNHTEVG
jgi:hypothetical protein